MKSDLQVGFMFLMQSEKDIETQIFSLTLYRETNILGSLCVISNSLPQNRR